MYIPIDYASLWRDAKTLLDAGKALHKAIADYLDVIVDRAVDDGVFDTPFDGALGRPIPDDWLAERMALELAVIGQAAYGVQAAITSNGLNQGFSIHDHDPHTKSLAFSLRFWKKVIRRIVTALTKASSTDVMRLLHSRRGSLQREIMDLEVTILRGIEAMDVTPHQDAIAQEPADQKPTPERINRYEADALARQLAEKDHRFRHGTAEEWAAAISKASGKSCSATTIKATAFWNTEMEVSNRGRSRLRPSKAVRGRTTEIVTIGRKHESLKAAIEREDEGDEVQADLIRQERAATIEAVRNSGMDDEAKQTTFEKLTRGAMTDSQAKELVALFPPKKRPGHLSRD